MLIFCFCNTPHWACAYESETDMQHICSDKLLEKVSDQFIRTLRSDKFYVDSSWKPYLFFMNSLWFLCGSHLKSLRFLCGFLMESLWLLLPCHYVRLKDWAPHQHDVTKHMQSIWHGMAKPCSIKKHIAYMFFVNPLWFLCVSHLKSLWFLCGFLMESLWLLLQCHYVRLRDWAPHQHDWPSICKAYGMAWQGLALSNTRKYQNRRSI